jgi:hypothetical protein
LITSAEQASMRWFTDFAKVGDRVQECFHSQAWQRPSGERETPCHQLRDGAEATRTSARKYIR